MIVFIAGNLLQLGVLSLRDNKLSYLPSEVGNCKELHVLDVSGNRLVLQYDKLIEDKRHYEFII